MTEVCSFSWTVISPFSVTISWFRRSQFPYLHFQGYGKKVYLQLVFMFAFVDCPTWSYRNSETARSKKESYCQKTSKSAIKTKVTRTCRGKEAYWCTNWALFGGVKWSCWRSWCWNTDWCLSWSTPFSIVHPCKEWSGCCNSNFGGRSMLSHFQLKLPILSKSHMECWFCLFEWYIYTWCNVQGSYGSWKTWKVLEFYYGIFQDWKVLEKGHWSWKVLEIC